MLQHHHGRYHSSNPHPNSPSYSSCNFHRMMKDSLMGRSHTRGRPWLGIGPLNTHKSRSNWVDKSSSASMAAVDIAAAPCR